MQRQRLDDLMIWKPFRNGKKCRCCASAVFTILNETPTGEKPEKAGSSTEIKKRGKGKEEAGKRGAKKNSE